MISADGLALVPSIRIMGSKSHLVYVGDNEETVEAKFIAADECLDIALIDLEGEDYPFLELADTDLQRGDDVYGPLWNRARARYELIDGVVESLDNPGNTTGRSVPSLIRYQTEENTARFGPVVNEEGELMGLAAGSTLDENVDYVQRMVPLDAVLPVLDGLLDGENGAWIGLSSWASNHYWMWVSGIRVGEAHPGSPAEAIGVEKDDTILDLAGQAMSADGAKRAYCEILRSADPDEPIPVTVYREATGDVLAGEIWGDPLEIVGTLDDYVAPVPTLADGDITNDLIGRPLAVDWSTLYSPDGNLKLEVPAGWDIESDTDRDSVVFRAAPNLIRFNLDRGNNPVGGEVVGVTVVVHKIGDTTDATAEDLMDLAEGWLGEYDDDPACRSGFSDRMPYPSPALPDYWVLQDWYCDDGMRITEIVGISHGDPGMVIVTSLVAPGDVSVDYEWIAWSARDPEDPVVAPGWRRHTLPDGSLSIGIPPGWSAVDESSDPDAEGAERVSDENVLFSIDGDPALRDDEFAFAILNRAPLDEDLLELLPDLDADWMAESTLPTLQALDALAGDVTYEIVTVPHGEAVRFEYGLEIGSGGDSVIMALVQYMYLSDSEIIGLTFGLVVEDLSAYEATMEASFAIPEAAGAGVAGTQRSTVERDDDGRPIALDWREVVSEFGNFAFQVPADWGISIKSGGTEQGVWAAPDLDAFMDEIYNETTAGTTGVTAIFRDAGDTSQNTDEELQDRARSLLFKESDLEGCSDPAPASTSDSFSSTPDFWEVNVYDCDGGYTLLNALGITRSESGRIMAFSIQAPAEEMSDLTWIADSVRIKEAQGVGPDEDNLADLDPETQVMLVAESGRFAVVIPLDMQMDMWFLEGDGDGDGIEEFMVSPELNYFRDDRLVDPPRASIPGVRIGIVDAEFLVGLDDDDLEGRLFNVLATHRLPKNCVELGPDVVQVGGAVEKYFLTSRLCGTRYQHLLLVGAITVEPGYLIIIDLVATLDTDELETLLNIVDSLRMVEVVDPTP